MKEADDYKFLFKVIHTMTVTRFTLASMLAIFCSGCGTVFNHPEDGGRYPYGGVKTDYYMGGGHQLGCGPWWFLDLPFSVVGDTLLLPSDAYYRHQVKAYQASLKHDPPDPDPLAAWKCDSDVQPDKDIVEDYQGYIQTLPPDQKKSLIVNQYMVMLFEDGTGGHAMQIKIGIDGTLWKHVLIYDKSNKRIKVLKYENGHNRS
jgi:uncharacterized protein YceK